MAYEISFTKELAIHNTSEYVNECCWGGDAVRDQLLPLIAEKFEKIQTDQEDWGWFIWFRQGPVYLTIDIFCDDPESGKFRIHLTSRTKKFGLINKVADTPDLERVREMVCSKIEAWAGSCQVEPIER
jgi:hypothetical protein